jgi:hypothetical protein
MQFDLTLCGIVLNHVPRYEAWRGIMVQRCAVLRGIYIQILYIKKIPRYEAPQRWTMVHGPHNISNLLIFVNIVPFVHSTSQLI